MSTEQNIRRQQINLKLMKWSPQKPQFKDAIEARCDETGNIYVIISPDLAVLHNGATKLVNVPLDNGYNAKEQAEFHRNAQFILECKESKSPA